MTAYHFIAVDTTGPLSGPLDSLIDIAGPLLERGCHFTFLLPRGPACKKMADQFSDETVIPLDLGRLGPRYYARITAGLLRQQRHANSVFIANTSGIAPPIYLASVLAKRPAVIHLRNSALTPFERAHVSLAARAPWLSVLAVSAGAAEQLWPAGMAHTQLLPDAVARPARIRSSRPFSTPADIAVVANQGPTKGFDIFCQLLPQARSLGLEVRFHVFGSAGERPPRGSFLQQWHGWLKDSGLMDAIIWRGVVNDLDQALAQMDALVVTSRRESFSRTAVAAMRLRLPVVAPRIPGLWDTVGGERHVYGYEPADPVDAARALKTLLSDYPDALEKAEDAERWAEAFDPTRIASEFLQALNGP